VSNTFKTPAHRQNRAGPGANTRVESLPTPITGLTPISPNAAADGSNKDAYDFENRLIRRSDGSRSVEIIYDGDGNRVAKVILLNAAVQKVTFSLVDDQNSTGYAQVLEEFESTTLEVPAQSVRVLTRLYTYGYNRISQKLRDSSTFVESFYGYDGHGSVRFLMTDQGAITDTCTYDAYGILIARIGTTDNNYLFAGERFDPQLGLYHNRARYLNIGTGRFWTWIPSFVDRGMRPSSGAAM
jgi:RHS repeat-associated protein